MCASSQRSRRLRRPLSLRSCAHGSRRWLDSNSALTASASREARRTSRTARAAARRRAQEAARAPAPSGAAATRAGSRAQVASIAEAAPSPASTTTAAAALAASCSAAATPRRAATTGATPVASSKHDDQKASCNDWRHLGGAEQARPPRCHLPTRTAQTSPTDADCPVMTSHRPQSVEESESRRPPSLRAHSTSPTLLNARQKRSELKLSIQTTRQIRAAVRPVCSSLESSSTTRAITYDIGPIGQGQWVEAL